jgi:hypothetical protein
VPLPQKLNALVRQLLVGTPFGNVYPPKPPPPRSAQALDARTAAYRVLREYLSGIIFYLPPQNLQFQVHEDNFHLEAQDWNTERKYPAMAIAGSVSAEYEGVGLRPFLLEETQDLIAYGTVLQWHCDYIETFKLEVNASQEPALRALRAGLETAFNPVEERAGIQLTVPAYFGAPAEFVLQRAENLAETDAGKGRRQCNFLIDLHMPVLSLVRYVMTKTPHVQVATDYDPGTGQPVNVVPQFPGIPVTDPNAPIPPPDNAEYVLEQDAEDPPKRRWPG